MAKFNCKFHAEGKLERKSFKEEIAKLEKWITQKCISIGIDSTMHPRSCFAGTELMGMMPDISAYSFTGQRIMMFHN